MGIMINNIIGDNITQRGRPRFPDTSTLNLVFEYLMYLSGGGPQVKMPQIKNHRVGESIVKSTECVL